MKPYNEAMLVDFYELTMANGYFEAGRQDEIVYFDLFFRSIPDRGGYVIFAGLESVVEFIDELHFTDDDIAFLRSKNIFSEGFLTYLKHFKFSGDIYAFQEGSVMFPNEPIITIKAPIIEAQLLETFLLQIVNHQTLIATKASRIKYAAGKRFVQEMGARRAHGATSSLLGARAAYIGGVDATSNVLADQLYGVVASGTMAHSWVQLFDTEYEAFLHYANTYPNSSTFLVDTYDTLKSGLPNAIRVIKEVLLPQNATNYAIRIDSGDLAYLSQKAREILDKEGLTDCKVVVSNALDERLIRELLNQGAQIDIFGVGERLITAKSDPVFGAVYKLVAVEKDNVIVPKIKISENVDKITTPGFKQVYRIYNIQQKAEADLITLRNEEIDSSEPLTIFDPYNTWKTKEFSAYTIVPLQHKIFDQGTRVYNLPTLEEVRQHAQNELETLWLTSRRFDNPHKYYVDLSQKLWDVKNTLIKQQSK